MSSPKKQPQGAKPLLEPHAEPTVDDIAYPTLDHGAEFASASHATATRDEISRRNASSPLLRFPAELRNHIFALALNHGYIPITFPEHSHRWKIKGDARRGFEYRYHYKQICDFFYIPISFSPRSCSFKLEQHPVRDSGRLYHLRRPINLLYVCRQIYAESTLSPYELSIFAVVENFIVFKDFLKRRTSAQIGTLARVRRGPDTPVGAQPATEWLKAFWY
ncbi:hypothetical protein BKA58DRAFT_436989 [Alternaria rosae]|uniref:uncharacterized protein n=1 Tax=Alternaria rosae TaxID=1187941 RepID=UPI001E8E187F|nr:uncharacterized protein BKA58DRAFT_436989 [Alternaria rosae]KAH6879302.1 hypothetical protein BKA58DRAFT_436989 [Alternaria rosae]